jgi:cyclopropane-fatty-acyl-phospholipid synthase
MLLISWLKKLVRTGNLTVIDAGGRRHHFGGNDSPPVTIRLRDRRLHYQLLLNPELYLGEAYMDGTLTLEQGSLYDLLHACTADMTAIASQPLQRVRQRLDRMWKYLQQYNPAPRARNNVAHHYDLSGALFDKFLSADRQYSCAYFPTGNESLEEAQYLKQVHLGAKLLLKPGMKVLDIGCGWGSLALFLARESQANVTGVTLSTEQHHVAREHAVASGLADRVRFKLLDYRHETGIYDRIVSVGMFEHVGVRHYREFFDKVRAMLTTDGVAVIHSIGRMAGPGTTNAWIRKYIFPGGYAPALSEVLKVVERSGLFVTDIEVLQLHYADTLREWRRRFAQHRDEIKALYDERFCRMWEFYLTVSEISFRTLDQMVFQLQLVRRKEAVPRTRDYIVDWERRVLSGMSPGRKKKQA